MASLTASYPSLGIDSARPLTDELVAEVTEFCDRVEDRAESMADGDGTPVAVIRLRGAGPAGGWPGDVGVHQVSRWEKTLRRLERTRAAKLATVEGVCGGAGLELLLVTDYRVAAPGARFEISAAGGGVWAGMAVHRLVNQLGGARARQLVLFGAGLRAETARQIGLADEVADDPAGTASRCAERARRLAPAGLAVRRQLVLDAGVTSYDEALGAHLAACDQALRRARAATPEHAPR